jgi:topoisomerase-4 subunit A
VKDLPILAKGRGNKVVQVNPKDDELLHTLLSVPSGAGITVFAGKQHTTIGANDLKGYVGERGRRGRKLPRGYQRVDRAVIQNSG